MRIASEDRNSPKIRSVGGIINWMESVFELEMEISYIYIYIRDSVDCERFEKFEIARRRKVDTVKVIILFTSILSYPRLFRN